MNTSEREKRQLLDETQNQALDSKQRSLAIDDGLMSMMMMMMVMSITLTIIIVIKANRHNNIFYLGNNEFHTVINHAR